MPRPARLATWLAALILCAVAPAWAQITVPAPTTVLPPQELQPSRPAPLTFTPSVSVFEEYNDNVFLDNRDRRSDWITGIAPGFALALQSEAYKLRVGYNFTAELYARESRLNEVFDRQNLYLDGTYRVAKELTLSLTDYFIEDVNTNLVSASGLATGRSRAWNNAVTPGVVWEPSPVWTLRFSGTYELQRFDERTLADSDVYRLRGAAERRLTGRLTGMAGYEFGFFDIAHEPSVVTHTPWLGARYRFTPTLTGSVSAGPTVTVEEGGSTRLGPAVRAELRQQFSLGSASFGYDRTVTTAGGLGGTIDNDSVTALLRIQKLARGLTVDFAPRYTHARSADGRIDAHTWNVALRSAYQATTWLSVYLGYAFFEQRSSTGGAGDIDQNRVSFGVQIGYPQTFD